jgi:hypothetical protein
MGRNAGIAGNDIRVSRTLSRRDLRTEPGVLTPGTDQKMARPEGAEDIRSLLRSTTRKLLTILCHPLGRGLLGFVTLGLKRQAESCSPFGTEITSHLSFLT